MSEITSNTTNKIAKRMCINFVPFYPSDHFYFIQILHVIETGVFVFFYL